MVDLNKIYTNEQIDVLVTVVCLGPAYAPSYKVAVRPAGRADAAWQAWTWTATRPALDPILNELLALPHPADADPRAAVGVPAATASPAPATSMLPAVAALAAAPAAPPLLYMRRVQRLATGLRGLVRRVAQLATRREDASRVELA